MKFTDIFIKRPVLAISISIVIVILGLQAIFKLQVREYPEMVNTIVTVSTVYPGADAETMQSFVTSKLEESIAQANNIDYITSSSAANSSRITIKMRLNTNPGIAVADIASKVNAVRSELPLGIEDPSISASNGSMEAIMFVRFASNQLSAPQITDYVERVVKPQLFTVSGVSKVTIFGGTDFGLRIWLDPDKMAGLGLSAPEVMASLSVNNVQTAAGNTNGYFTAYANKVESTTRNVEQLSNLVVRTTASGQQIKLKDIAKIELDKNNDNSRAIVNGADAVVLAVEAASTANSLTVAKNLYPLFDKIKKDVPASMELEVMYDKTIAINSSIQEVIKTIFEATLIVLVVITLFLGSFRAMIIPIITIPISLVGVIMVLQGFGFSLNLLTLLGLILAIGLVVDDAIVVLENVDRHIKEGETPFRAAIIGTREIATPVIAMTVTLMAVYSPMALMGGITGTLFKEFALTLAGSVFISGVAALTLSPMMSSRILKKTEEGKQSKLERCVDGFLTKMTTCYTNMLSFVMTMRKSMLVFALAIFSTVPFLLKSLPTELAPSEDRGILMAIANGPSNVNLDYIQDIMVPFANETQKIPEVSATQIMPGYPSSNSAFALLPLVDWSERTRSQTEVLGAINQIIQRVAEVSIMAFPVPEISTGESDLPFSLVITTANDYTKLAEVAQQFLLEAQRSGKFFFSTLDLKFDTALMRINLDREKLGTYGITVQQISSTLGSYLSGATLARVDIDNRPYNIVSQVERRNRLNPQDLGNYFVTASNGDSIPLSAFVTMKLETRPASLSRLNQLNSAKITGILSGSMGDTVAWAEAKAAEILPAGYQYDFMSESRQYKQEGNALAITFSLAVVMIYLVLAIQFESWRDPLVILVSVPLAISGSLFVLNILGLAGVSGSTLNIYSQVGLITLVGLITKHGILMCEVAKEEQLHHGKSRAEAIFYAAKIRLRPILMTTAAMIAGLVPLLFATGAGAVMRFSIGIVIVAGLAIGTIFTLFVLPVIYTFLASEHKPLMEFDENQVNTKIK
ncbi:transporter [Vespertiliibacter pulmonis]|uniref:Multidrug efflux pump n=1 Tax=Vespertiliibacter pulmonis TaxID=1443036 RepID=A0A3N4VX88_9PAST|nr:efflux RND transporter permease subunit [Vespertiliibacter pulmonis]QLB21440.1 transporter [Vespertiliibacter pulmonis]RPE85855.1 multidrug efflux pump [Vespertiliibacter pulmonis]